MVDRKESPVPRNHSWQRLVSVVQKLSIAHDLPAIMTIVRSAARDLTGADGATFVLRDGNECFYADEDAIAPLWKGQRFPLSRCISGWVMLNRKAAMIEDIYADPRIPAAAYQPTFVKSLLMVPIRSEQPLGAIGNYWAQRHAPSAAEISLLGALADSTSLALANLDLLSTLDRKVREETRRLSAANRELEAFSYSVSHDLRSPLTAIKRYAELLAEDCGAALGGDALQSLSGINQSVTKMSTLIDALLSLGRVSRAELKPQPLNLRPAVLEIIAQLRAAEPGRNVDFHVADDLTADGDPALLRIVLDNLLANAWKYTSKRDAALIEVGKIPGAPIVLFVRDNGAGFDAARAERLFMPFQRMHSERDFPGIGVGLATVQRIIANHGGRIWADSVPGQGATFCFTLPVAGVTPQLRLAA
jgi:signal transduction histidine kinase